MKNLIWIAILLTATFTTHAQKDTKFELGVRLGSYFAGSAKYAVTDYQSIEAIVGVSRTGGTSLTSIGGSYQFYLPLSESLDIYGGVILFAVAGRDDIATVISPGGIGGLRYKFDDTPFSIFMDLAPVYSISKDASEFELLVSLGSRFGF